MLRPLGSPRLNACQEFGKRTAQSHPVRSGKSNVLHSGPIAGFSEGLRSKAERWRNATRGFVLNPNDSMRERLTYLRAPLDHAYVSKKARCWADESVGQPLVIALGVIMG